MTRSRRILAVLKFGLGAGLLVFLVRRIEFDAILAAIASVDARILAASLAISAVASIFEIAKFRAACHFRLGYRDSAILVLIGLFLSNFLPSNIGGDAYKVWAMRRHSISRAAGFAYVFADRMAGLLALIILGGVSYGVAKFTDPTGIVGRIQLQPAATTWISSSIAVSAVIVVLLVLVLASQARIRPRVQEPAARILAASKTYLSLPALVTLGHSLLLHVCRGFALSMLCRALGFAVPITPVFLVLLLVALVSTVPITIGGLGVREGTLAFLLQQCGMTAEAAFAAALISLGVLWLKSLGGAALFFVDRHAEGVEAFSIDDSGSEPL